MAAFLLAKIITILATSYIFLKITVLIRTVSFPLFYKKNSTVILSFLRRVRARDFLSKAIKKVHAKGQG
jgi:hypothetical protein